VRRGVVPVATLAVGAVLGATVVQLVGGTAEPVTASAAGTDAVAGPAAPTTAPPAGVRVDLAAYRGRPLADVTRELTGRGLVVTQAAETSTAVPPGDVLAVTPDGVLAAGDTVLVTWADPPAPAAPSSAAVAAPVPAVTSSSPAPAAVTRAPVARTPVVRAPAPPVGKPGRGGHGRGHGRGGGRDG
jgi:serine/threonine-protein kinase